MKKAIFFLQLFFIITTHLFAQIDTNHIDSTTNIPQVDSLSIQTLESSSYSSFLPPDFIITPPSPSAAGLGSFGDMEIGLFTGTMQHSIPVYTFNTQDLSYPVVLSYKSNGLKVDELASWVGYGWNINSSGIINRYKHGFVDKPGNRISYPDWDNMSAHDKITFFDTYLINSSNDLEPDIFEFCFLNYSGKFAMDENGQPVQIPYSNLKIETNSTGPQFNYFKITAPDGIIYRFDETATSDPYGDDPAFVSSWYLTEIIHPSGDSISFSYDKIYITQEIATVQELSIVVQSTSTGETYCPPDQEVEMILSSYNQVCFIDTIDFHKYGKIIFEKSLNRSDSDDDYRLDKIIVQDQNNNQTRAFQFFYQFPFCLTNYPDGPSGQGISPDNDHGYHMFLDSVQFLDGNNQRINSYSFYYNNLDELPARFSYAQDYWGYFNGKYNSEFVDLNEVPSLFQAYFPITNNCDKTANYLYSKKGLLNKIVYPTGGYTEIDYEANQKTTGEQVGGCRVLRTRTFDVVTESVQIKKYNYTYSNTSYGINSFNIYDTEFHSYDGSGTCQIGVLSSNSLHNLNLGGQYHIVYPNIEIYYGENAQNGKKSYNFHTGWDAEGISINGYDIPLVKDNSGWKNGLQNFNITYNASQEPVQKEQLSYNFYEQRNCRELSCMAIRKRPIPDGIIRTDDYDLQYYDVVPYLLYSKWYYVDTLKKTDYISTEEINTNTAFLYENEEHALLSQEIITNSDGNSRKTKYYYPQDYDSVQNFSILTGKHIINNPIDVRTYTNSQLISGTQTKYNNDGQPTDIYIAETGNGITDIEFDAGDPYLFTHRGTYLYNTGKKIKQILPDDNLNTVYLWDSTNNYVMAKVENAEYGDIDQYDGQTFSTDSKVLFANIRTLVPNAMITTFTHKPLFGITQQTGPDGRTIYYEYDDFGRLQYTRDSQENIINKYRYHYAEQ